MDGEGAGIDITMRESDRNHDADAPSVDALDKDGWQTPQTLHGGERPRLASSRVLRNVTSNGFLSVMRNGGGRGREDMGIAAGAREMGTTEEGADAITWRDTVCTSAGGGNGGQNHRGGVRRQYGAFR